MLLNLRQSLSVHPFYWIKRRESRIYHAIVELVKDTSQAHGGPLQRTPRRKYTVALEWILICYIGTPDPKWISPDGRFPRRQTFTNERVERSSNQQANWSLNGEISSKMGSLLVLIGAHWFINCSSPSMQASSIILDLERFEDDGADWYFSSSCSSSSARFLDLASSDPETLPCNTSSRHVLASACRDCLIRHRHKLQALFASGSIIWALR